MNDPTTGLPLPNDQISVTRFDPAAVALAKYLPQTADPCGKASYGIPVQSDETQIVGRVDWIVNSRHTLYGRYFSDAYNLAAFFDPHDILVTSTTGNDEHAQSFVLVQESISACGRLPTCAAPLEAVRFQRGHRTATVRERLLAILHRKVTNERTLG